MNNMNLRGSSRQAPGRVPSIIRDFRRPCAHRAERTSIRFATLLGCLIAFALLCVISMQAKAVSLNGSPSTASLAVNSTRAGEAGIFGTMTHLPQPLDDGNGDAPEGAAFGRPLAPGSNDNGYVSTDTTQDDASGRPTWLFALALALALSLVVGVAVALVGACLSRAALRRLVEKQKQTTDQWARRYDAAEARERAAHIAAWDHANATVTSGPNAVARVSFDAPFTVAQKRSSSNCVPDNAQASARAIATTQDDSVSSSYEPFDHRFLDSLSEEGLDLAVFLDGWRRAMDDDLAHLSLLSRQSDPDYLRSVLHRLSGAVGLVGAHSLMEALRRASASPLEQNEVSIASLIERGSRLAMQLEARSVVVRNP
jgi:hypothetical protein